MISYLADAMYPNMKTLLLPLLSSLAFMAVPTSAQTWYGREIAATAEPIRTVDLDGRTVRPGEADDRWDGRYGPPRYLYVDPLGRTTIWVGVPPAWLADLIEARRARQLRPGEAVPAPAARPKEPEDRCSKGLSGAASASAALGAAASVNGIACR